MKILIIRFRQMGDAILSTVVAESLKQNFPNAEVHLVLNDNIYPLFATHHAIDRVITFTHHERHSLFVYLKKIRSLMRQNRYDVIIDLRTTINTLPFAWFSRGTGYRMGLDKFYAKCFYNHLIPRIADDEPVVMHNLKFLQPLNEIKPLKLTPHFSIDTSDEEVRAFKAYMQEQGIDFARKIILVGVTAKLARKTWPESDMCHVLSRLIEKYPQAQLIFNYAPGQEAQNAKRIYELLGKPANVFMNIEAKSMPALACMVSNIDLYFGNEGGTRHIVQALGKPSFCICSPTADPRHWIYDSGVPAEAVAYDDFLPRQKVTSDNYDMLYKAIDREQVLLRLSQFLEKHL